MGQYKNIHGILESAIILNKLSTIFSAEDIEAFIEALTENGIEKGTEPLWAK
jgi:hypothetical protein